MQIDRDQLVALTRDMVRISSVNPMIDPTGPGEAELVAYLAPRLSALGAEVTIHEAAPGRASLVARLAGAGGGPSLMLNAHLDTVGVAGMDDPFSGEIRDGRLYGRGAYDMKGSLAACVGAISALVNSGLPLAGDLILAAVADEEHASLGTADVIARYRVDAAIVTEPTALRICRAHKGFIWLQVETFGRAAHGSRPDLGIDANLAMGRVLAELAILQEELRFRDPHPLIGTPSLHAATIQGGTGLSTYAAHCVLQVERRTVPGEKVDEVVDEFRRLLERLSEKDPAFRAELRVLMNREPFEVGSDGPLLAALEQGAAEVIGRAPHVGESFWMDAALLSAAGIETVVIGPDGGGAHADEEWVDLESLELLAATLASTALLYCGTVD
ncbi:ArgE/DapE family deacylase [soil metagenome]